MIHKGAVIPFYDLHFYGEFTSPIRMIPKLEGEWFHIKYRPDDLGLDGTDIEPRLRFDFVDDCYTTIWAGNDGEAEVEVRWQSNSNELQQFIDLRLFRIYTEEYWIENWRNHHFHKNTKPNQVEYYLPEILKYAKCPLCSQETRLLVMPYDDTDSGWMCAGCASLHDVWLRVRNQNRAMKELIRLGHEGELAPDWVTNPDENENT